MTPLSESVYFAAQMVGQTFIHVLSITVIFASGAIINGVSLSALEWIASGLWILFGSLPFLAIGTLIGLMKKVETAAGISNVLYMVLAVTGGMWMPLEIMPEMMQTIGKSLPAFHFGSGAWEIVQGGMPNWKNFLILVTYLVLFMLLSKYIRSKQEAV
jgi:ABC-2 type transport system permease protein